MTTESVKTVAHTTPGPRVGRLAARRIGDPFGCRVAGPGNAPGATSSLSGGDRFDEIVEREKLSAAHWGQGGVWGVDPNLRVTFVEADRRMAAASTSGEWALVRAKVLRRDKHRCQRCRTSKGLTAHHLIPRHEGGSDDLRNLLTLCRPCHDWAEANQPSWQALTSGAGR